MMELLISKSDVEQYFKIALGRNEKEFENFIRESQMFDLKDLMPEKFFYDMLANKDQDNYKTLINGGKYEYEEQKYQHEGIKGVLAHFSYGLYLLRANITDTSFGLVTKRNNNSEPVEYKERKDWYYKHREQAAQLWEEVKRFLDRNKTDYPVWEECNPDNTNHSFKTKIIQ